MFVVSGVTGQTGSVVAQTLLNAGKNVRVIVRSEEKGQIWKDRGAEVAIADLNNIDSLTKALNNATAAYLMLPPDYSTDAFIATRKVMAENLLAAVQEAKLPYAVLLSSVGAELESNSGAIKTLHNLENIFKNSDLKFAAVRPGYFMENWASVVPVIQNDGVLPSFLQPLDKKIDMIATQDIGEIIANLLQNPVEDKQHFVEIKGAAQYSANDVAQAFGTAFNKEVSPIAVPREAWVDSLTQAGISEDVATLYAEMYENVNNDNINFHNINARHGKINLEQIIEKLVA